MLQISGLAKRFGSVVALDGLHLTARPGRLLGFLGPNGSGKTTTMRAIFDLIRPDAGDITYRGHPPTREDRLRFGYMPEERGLYPKMRIGEQLEYFARLSGLDRSQAAAAADEWLGTFSLADRSGDKLEDLSHGNQQRVQLAAALVHRPELAVLDEPFAGLDPMGMDAMAEALRALAQDGAAIVFSSHQLDLVEDICQDVVIIDAGRDVLSGDVHSLRNRSAIRHLEIEVDGTAWEGEVPGTSAITRNGRKRYVVDRSARIGDLLATAAGDGEVTRFSFEPPRLSELFREAVKG